MTGVCGWGVCVCVCVCVCVTLGVKYQGGNDGGECTGVTECPGMLLLRASSS